MTDVPHENRGAGKSFRRLVESRLLWKYVALILGLVVASTFLGLQSENETVATLQVDSPSDDGSQTGTVTTTQEGPFSKSQVAQGLFYSVVTALVVSLFYDFGTRRDLYLLVQHEREMERDSLRGQFIATTDLELLSSDEMDSLASRIAESDSMLERVSTSLLGPQGSIFYESWLRPLVDREVLYEVKISNVLCSIDGRDDAYCMRFSQSFRAPATKRSFVIVVTCDNEIYNDLVTSDTTADEMVGTSSEEWISIDVQLESLRLRSWRVSGGHRHNEDLTGHSLDETELSEYLARPFDVNLVRGFSFELHPDSDWHYQLDYSVTNRLSDPYYYWLAEMPMFVERLSFDYRDLRTVMGRVSANCILGSSAGEPVHDPEEGSYYVDVHCLVWPGQGGILVWRGPDSDTPVST